MAYDHTKQYRAAIVRGKGISDLDNFLPTYANILYEVCPVPQEKFKEAFNSRIAKLLDIGVVKTLDNHRTEIAGKLFGMYYIDSDDNVCISRRASKLLEDSDQPAFFKDLCAKYQFPSGMNKIEQTVKPQLESGISCRQFSYIIAVLKLLEENEVYISKKQLGYYVLNSLDVLTKRASPQEVCEQIIDDINKKIKRKIDLPNKAASYTYQHINEQLNLLALANAIRFAGSIVKLNNREQAYLDALAERWCDEPSFNFKVYDLDSVEGRKTAEYEWNKYFSDMSDIDKSLLFTEVHALEDTKDEHKTDYTHLEKKHPGENMVALGDEGENYVYEYERNKIQKINPRLLSRVKKLGRIKGIGYDIQSVLGEGERQDWAKYIEVKATKRVTAPSEPFNDSINLTRNEWLAAEQFPNCYFIYRVYFTEHGVKLFIISNPYQQNQDETLNCVATNYRMDFTENSGSFISK